MTPAKQRLLITGLIVLGILTVGFFGLRAKDALKEFRGHRPPFFNAGHSPAAETDVNLIREWMTVPYIAKTYHVPPPVLFDALQIKPAGNHEKSLSQLNDEYYSQARGIVIEIVKAAIRANQPVPTALPPLTPVPPVVP